MTFFNAIHLQSAQRIEKRNGMKEGKEINSDRQTENVWGGRNGKINFALINYTI